MAISADSPQDSEKLTRRLGLTYPLLADPSLEVIKAYGVRMEHRQIAVPTTFVLTADREVVWRRQSETQFDRPSLRALQREVARARKR